MTTFSLEGDAAARYLEAAREETWGAHARAEWKSIRWGSPITIR